MTPRLYWKNASREARKLTSKGYFYKAYLKAFTVGETYSEPGYARWKIGSSTAAQFNSNLSTVNG